MDYIHRGKFGDIICFLPAMKYRPGKLYISSHEMEGYMLGPRYYPPEIYAPIVPLLELQPYVEAVEEYKGQDAVDANLWQLNYKDEGNIAEDVLSYLNVPLDILKEPWLEVPKKKVASHVINRNITYYNQWGGFPTHEVGEDAVFIGTKKEHEFFCDKFKKIPYYETKDFLEAASVIAGSDLFIGNQSACYWICEALKHNSVVEMFPGPCVYVNIYVDKPGEKRIITVRNGYTCFDRPNAKWYLDGRETQFDFKNNIPSEVRIPK